MLKDNGHIDKMFSDGLQNLSVQPRKEVWTNINASVKLARKKKRAAVIFISLAVAASLALLFTLSNSSLFQNELEFHESELFSDLDTTLSQNEAESVLMNDKMDVINNKTENTLTDTKGLSKKMNKELLPLNKTKIPKLYSQRKIVLQMALPKMEQAKLYNPSLNMRLLDKGKDKTAITILSKLKDSLIIARNLKMLGYFDKSERKKKEWSILGQVSSAYSSYNGDKSGNNSEEGLISIGGGVKLNWQASKKIAIQTGLIYNKFGQQLAGRASVLESAFIDDVATKENMNSNIETSAGHIKMKEVPLFSAESNQFLSERVSASSSSDMVQSFEAIEIPLILRYNLIDKRFDLHMSGGLSTNLMVRNRVYDKNSKKTLGKTSGIRSTNFSTSFSLGLEYQLNSKFCLSMEPAFKYYLNSINKDSNYNYKPYSIGLSSGIRYKF